MKYRIREQNGTFFPEVRILWVWWDYECGFYTLDDAINFIKKEQTFRNRDKRITYHYVEDTVVEN